MAETADVNPELNATAGSLLGFLTLGPSSGYELAERIESSIGNFWNVTRSQIYRELRTLEQMGFVSAGGRSARDRTPYSVTPAGERACCRAGASLSGAHAALRHYARRDDPEVDRLDQIALKKVVTETRAVRKRMS